MKKINGITSQPKQQMTLQLDDGSQATLYLAFIPQQFGWVFNLTWGSFTLNGVRLTAQPNVFRQWKNILPFGIMVDSPGHLDPFTQEAFTIDGATLLLLSAADVETVENTIFAGY